MGQQEKEIIDLFREMKTERQGAGVTVEGLAVLTAARLLKRAMEKCAIEICGSIEQSKPDTELHLTLPQAEGILEMDRIAYSEGQSPRGKEQCDGWCEMLSLAEMITGRTAESNVDLAVEARRQAADETRRSRMGEAQRAVRRDLADMGE
jgi:hypothetical protein